MKQTWERIRDGSLCIDVDRVPLRDIAQDWKRSTSGARVVIVP